MQETQVWSLVWEESICCGATKPMSQNYWAQALDPWAATAEPTHRKILVPACLRGIAPQKDKPLLQETCELQLEISPHLLH